MESKNIDSSKLGGTGFNIGGPSSGGRSEGNIGESNKTSVKVHHAPGGASSFSLGGGYEPEKKEEENKEAVLKLAEERAEQEKAAEEALKIKEAQESHATPASDTHTSVKINAPPGGASSFTFG